MKEEKNLKSIEKETRWSNMTAGQKCISVWFGLSFALLVVCSESLLLTAIAVVNLGLAAYNVVKHVPLNG
jgi:hypothetical protein